MAQSKNSPQKVNAAQKRAEALRLRAGGATYAEIGEALGVSEGMGRKYVQTGLDALKDDMLASRGLLKTRIEDLIKAHWPAAVGTPTVAADPESAGLVLRLLDRVAKLEGLDAPTKTAADVKVSSLAALSDEELEAEARRLGVNPAATPTVPDLADSDTEEPAE